MLFMSMGWDYVSELPLTTGLLFISQMIYESGEPRWNDTDSVKPKSSVKNLSQYHFVRRKSNMDWLGREPGPQRREFGD
jgi:hypothetical protein